MTRTLTDSFRIRAAPRRRAADGASCCTLGADFTRCSAKIDKTYLSESWRQTVHSWATAQNNQPKNHKAWLNSGFHSLQLGHTGNDAQTLCFVVSVMQWVPSGWDSSRTTMRYPCWANGNTVLGLQRNCGQELSNLLRYENNQMQLFANKSLFMKGTSLIKKKPEIQTWASVGEKLPTWVLRCLKTSLCMLLQQSCNIAPPWTTISYLALSSSNQALNCAEF